MHEATFPLCCLSWKCSWHFPQLPWFLASKSPFLWLLSLLWCLHLSCCQDNLGWDTVGQSSVFPPLMLMSFHNCPSSCSDSLAKYWSFYILLPFFFLLSHYSSPPCNLRSPLSSQAGSLALSPEPVWGLTLSWPFPCHPKKPFGFLLVRQTDTQIMLTKCCLPSYMEEPLTQ